MRWILALIALLASVAAAVFLWRSRRQQTTELWDEVRDSASSWRATAEDKIDEATEKVAAMSDQASRTASDGPDAVRER